MKTLKNIFVLTLLIVNCSLLIAQKSDQHVTVKRGDYKELSFRHTGNVTASDITFVVKLTKSFSSPRLIQKANDDTTEISTIYSSPYTYIKVKLLQNDTRDFTSTKYFYDIVADSATIFDGEFRINQDVQTPFDGTTPPTSGSRFYVAGTFIDSTVADSSLFMWDSTSQTMKTVTKEQVRSYLDIEADLNSKVDLTSQQTIIGPKTLESPLTFTRLLSISKMLEFVPTETTSASWTISTHDADFQPSIIGKDHVFNVGYNWEGLKTNRSQFGMQFEPNYEYTTSQTVYEWFCYYNNLPSPSTTYGVRPFQIGIYAPYSYNKDSIITSAGFDVDQFWVYNALGTTPHFTLQNNLLNIYNPVELTNTGITDALKFSSDSTAYIHWETGVHWRMGVNNLGFFNLYSGGTSKYSPGYRRLFMDADSVVHRSSYHKFAGINGAEGLLITAFTDGNTSLKNSAYLTVDASNIWMRDYSGNVRATFDSYGFTSGSTSSFGTGNIYAGTYYTGNTVGYLSSNLGALTASGLYVASSSGGSPTRQLYYRTLTINGVTIQVITTETP